MRAVFHLMWERGVVRIAVVAGSDWVIDTGPGGGDEGGMLVAQGTPEEVAKNKQSKTAIYLTRTLNGHP